MCDSEDEAERRAKALIDLSQAIMMSSQQKIVPLRLGASSVSGITWHLHLSDLRLAGQAG